MMLQFAFDPKKRERFLSFWNLLSVEQYEDVVTNPHRFFVRYLSLCWEEREVVAMLLRYFLRHHPSWISLQDQSFVCDGGSTSLGKDNHRMEAHHSTLQEQSIPDALVKDVIADAAETETDEESSMVLSWSTLLQRLDSVGILELKKNRIYLHSKEDRVQLSLSFLRLLQKIPLLEEELCVESVSLKKIRSIQTASQMQSTHKKWWKQLENEYAMDFLQQDLNKNAEQWLVEMLQQKTLRFGFRRDFHPVVILSALEEQPGQQKKDLSRKNKPENKDCFNKTFYEVETMPLLFYKVERLLYLAHIERPIHLERKQFSVRSMYIAKVLARYYTKRNIATQWVRQTFHQKIHQILQENIPYGKKICSLLSSDTCSCQCLSKRALFYCFMHHQTYHHQSVVRYSLFLKQVERLIRYGFLVEKKQLIFFF